MNNSLRSFFKGLLLCALSFLMYVQNLSAVSSQHHSVRLSGHVPTKPINKAQFLKPMAADEHVSMTFVLPLRNQVELEDLVKKMYDPTDHEHYGKYMTSATFIERFAPTHEDYHAVMDYAKKLGFVVTGTHANRLLLNVTGKAASVESAFNLRMQHYKHANGRQFYAPSDNPEVPAALSSIISGVVGLDNHAKWHAHHRRKEGVVQSLNEQMKSIEFPSGPGGGFAPQDLVIAYNLTGVSATGLGQAIALFELASYQSSDITAYTNHFGLPAANLHNILVDGGSGEGIDAEVTLDIELALALAPASQIYVYEGPNTAQGVLDTYNRIATDNIAKQVSTSWGLGEDLVSDRYLQAENAIFLQMAAHGQTVYAAAGDSGAYDDYWNNSSQKLVVDDPASQPYVTGVGGTRLTVDPNTGAYQNETVWNEGLGQGAGGGGVSDFWTIPSWQTGVSSLSSTTNRNVPDVALNSDPNTGYSIYFDGQWQIYGGTSCAAPLWASFTALVNQARAANQQSTLGFANPLFYTNGVSNSYSSDFHDIISGNNLYYTATTRYDNATGWGSFNGANLFQTLTNSVSVPISVAPALHISMSNGSLKQGKKGVYQIVVSNGGNGATTGAVALVVNFPSWLSYKSFSGSGWSYNKKTKTFTQSSSLQPGRSYSTLNITVDVQKRAPRSITTTASVSGGGSASATATSTATVR